MGEVVWYHFCAVFCTQVISCNSTCTTWNKMVPKVNTFFSMTKKRSFNLWNHFIPCNLGEVVWYHFCAVFCTKMISCNSTYITAWNKMIPNVKRKISIIKKIISTFGIILFQVVEVKLCDITFVQCYCTKMITHNFTYTTWNKMVPKVERLFFII
jgi:hypothetical protein